MKFRLRGKKRFGNISSCPGPGHIALNLARAIIIKHEREPYYANMPKL